MQSYINYNDKNMSIEILPYYFQFNDLYHTHYDLNEVKGFTKFYEESSYTSTDYTIILFDRRTSKEIEIFYENMKTRNDDYDRLINTFKETCLLMTDEVK